MRAVWILGFLLPALAQQKPVEPQEEVPVFRTGRSLALVAFHVVQHNRYAMDIRQGDVELLEDGQPRKIALFEGGATKRQVPVEMALVFDISGSVMQEGLLDPLVYKSTMLDGLGGARLAVYGFDASLERFCRPTREFDELKDCLDRVMGYRSGSQPRPEVIGLQLPAKRKSDSRGGTWLYESVLAAAKDMAAGAGNATRLMLVFSDGFPSTTTGPEDILPGLNELGIAVYPVALGHQRLVERGKAIRESGYNGSAVLSEAARNGLQRIQAQELQIMEFTSLGESTGARSFDPPAINLLMLQNILGFMVGQVQCEYVVGFSPDGSSGPPTMHRLEVRLRSKDLGKLLGGARTVIH